MIRARGGSHGTTHGLMGGLGLNRISFRWHAAPSTVRRQQSHAVPCRGRSWPSTWAGRTMNGKLGISAVEDAADLRT